jgi:DNA-binding transcriptional ArsR family regulator
MYSSYTMINVDSIHKALASSLRRDVLRWLRDPSVHFPGADPLLPHGVSVGMIHARTGLSKSTVSAHLSTLRPDS